jgi:transposase-like protein
MGNQTLVPPHSFCWNASCQAYAQLDLDNIRKFGRTPAGVQRYQCRICRHTFVETIGTVFYGRRRSQETIIDCLALLAERNSLAAIHRVKGVKEETVLSWLHIAAAHVEQIEALLLATYKLSRAQLDAMWTYVGNKGEKGAMMKPMSVAPSGAA